jgi:hypothetical protein
MFLLDNRHVSCRCSRRSLACDGGLSLSVLAGYIF